MVIWRKPHNGDDEDVKTSTISTKPVKEDEMTYLKFLKVSSVPPPSNVLNTMKVKTVSLDNRVSRPSLMLPKILSKDMDYIYFTFQVSIESFCHEVDLDMCTMMTCIKKLIWIFTNLCTVPLSILQQKLTLMSMLI